MKIKALLSVLIACCLQLPGFTQDVKARLETDTIRIGDHLEYQLQVSLASGDTAVFPGFSDTLVSGVEVLGATAPRYLQDEDVLAKTYRITAFDTGQYVIPPQGITYISTQDSTEVFSDSLLLTVEAFVLVDTLKRDTVYAHYDGVLVFGKNNFERDIQKQIPDSLRQQLSPDTLAMLEDSLRAQYMQIFVAQVMRNTGMQSQNDIIEIAGSPLQKLFIANMNGIREDHRIPGTYDTVFVREYDTVQVRQPLYTYIPGKDIDDSLYKTAFNFAELWYYIWGFLKKHYWWLIPALLLIAALVYYFFFHTKGKKIFAEKLPPPEPAHIIAFRELERIKNEKLWEKRQYKAYFTDLSESLRRYLENRYDILAMEQTTFDIMRNLDRMDYGDASQREELRKILEQADLVKFAKMEPLPGESERCVRAAWEFVEKTKETPEEDTEILSSELEQHEPKQNKEK